MIAKIYGSKISKSKNKVFECGYKKNLKNNNKFFKKNLFFLQFHTEGISFNKNMELLAALLSLCMLIGYDISALTMPLYEGVSLGEGGVEPKPFGIPINLIHFNTMLLIQLVSLGLVLRRRKDRSL